MFLQKIYSECFLVVTFLQQVSVFVVINIIKTFMDFDQKACADDCNVVMTTELSLPPRW